MPIDLLWADCLVLRAVRYASSRSLGASIGGLLSLIQPGQLKFELRRSFHCGIF
jgi:hypothetical protein